MVVQITIRKIKLWGESLIYLWDPLEYGSFEVHPTVKFHPIPQGVPLRVRRCGSPLVRGA